MSPQEANPILKCQRIAGSKENIKKTVYRGKVRPHIEWMTASLSHKIMDIIITGIITTEVRSTPIRTMYEITGTSNIQKWRGCKTMNSFGIKISSQSITNAHQSERTRCKKTRI
ncbi:hypothetical protein DPMN_096892 [Dreissena polymorpha]|uniref:Uncharacterized protein n=1 Tax=Dreissena polymorpha TaxID=45954 RepID=A0A9D4R478_DREPO|nr:hypothetical protein DPMN_096892 [Dreissena polymorpha]